MEFGTQGQPSSYQPAPMESGTQGQPSSYQPAPMESGTVSCFCGSAKDLVLTCKTKRSEGSFKPESGSPPTPTTCPPLKKTTTTKPKEMRQSHQG